MLEILEIFLEIVRACRERVPKKFTRSSVQISSNEHFLFFTDVTIALNNIHTIYYIFNT